MPVQKKQKRERVAFLHTKHLMGVLAIKEIKPGGSRIWIIDGSIYFPFPFFREVI